MKIKKLENIVNLGDLIYYMHSCEETWKLIDKYNDFALRYGKQDKAVKEMVKYLIENKVEKIKTEARELAEEFTYVIREGKSHYIIKRRYNDYKLCVHLLKLDGNKVNGRLETLVDKIYEDYERGRKNETLRT